MKVLPESENKFRQFRLYAAIAVLLQAAQKQGVAMDVGMDLQAALQNAQQAASAFDERNGNAYYQQQLATQPLLDFAVFKDHPLAFLQPQANERLVMVTGVKQPEVLKQLQNDHIHFQQPITAMSEMFAEHRVQAQHLLIYALIGLAVGLALIYGLSSIVPLVLPVSLALLSTFAVQAWLGVEINLFSIMATFLIIGIGVDYAIFYRHGRDHPQVVGMALFLCMMSTLLGFGLLSFSHTYAIHCFGLTVLFGVIFSFIYATLLTPADEKHIVNLQDHS